MGLNFTSCSLLAGKNFTTEGNEQTGWNTQQTEANILTEPSFDLENDKTRRGITGSYAKDGILVLEWKSYTNSWQ